MERLQFSTKYLLKPEAEALFMKQIMELREINEQDRERMNIIFKEKIKLAKDQSKELGRKLGEKIGLEKGKIEGITIGEQKRNIEIAKMMLKSGEPVEKIMCFTGLSASDIQQLS